MSDKKQMIGKLLGESMTLEDVKELNKLQTLIEAGVLEPGLIQSIINTAVINIFRQYFRTNCRSEEIDKDICNAVRDIGMDMKEMVESRKDEVDISLDEVDISLTTLAAMKEVIGRTQNPSLILRALPVFHDIHYETKQMGIDEIKDLTEMLTDGIAQQWIDGIMSIKLPIIGNMKLKGDA